MGVLDQILHRMNRLCVTQRLLAERIGVSEVRVHQILSEPFNPTLKTLRRVCSALNLEIRIRP